MSRVFPAKKAGVLVQGYRTEGKSFFMQLAHNLHNGVTDTLESSTILTYSKEHMSLYTQNLGRTQ
jgi:hypothetical protein